ncbi:MAG: PRTRC system protein C [Bacteroidales bacterium]|nr:PRTRC system protein C [Bacteroidales bacterium]
MALQVNIKERVFKYKNEELVDPDRNMTPFEVAKFYSARFPELINATIEGPKAVDGKVEYSFDKVAGTKG